MALLDICNVTIRFGGLTAVNHVDLQIDPGKIVSVIGPNGAGKTTLFNAITGIYEPTEGDIALQGQAIGLPLRWYNVLLWLVMGAIAAALTVLIGMNVDNVWKAAVKPDRLDWEGGWNYLQGNLGLQKNRQRGWRVVTANGETLAEAATDEEARKWRRELQQIITAGADDNLLHQHGAQWSIVTPDGERVETFTTEDAARQRLRQLASVADARINHQRFALVLLIVGGLIGVSSGVLFWRRTRRTPEVIARSGIARTFQNIRLFRSMTVVENVLVGMDRTFTSGGWGMLLGAFGINPEEKAGVNRAMDLLNFFGLAHKANMLAKNLPYGDQRRLEIARALASQPRLLLLDEPAAGMNPSEGATLMAHIGRIRNRGVTLLLIEHHMHIVMAISDHIAVLQYGTKIGEGTPQEVRNNPAVIEAYLGKDEEH